MEYLVLKASDVKGQQSKLKNAKFIRDKLEKENNENYLICKCVDNH